MALWKIVEATLATRIGGNHLGGRVRGSTFRLTLAAALRRSLRLTVEGPKRLAPASEKKLTEWMTEHLQVAVHPFDDRDPLGDLEDRVLDRLDPPLNLDGRPPSSVRARLSRLRAEIAEALTSTVEAPRHETSAGLERLPPKTVAPQGDHAGRREITLHAELQAILDERGNRWMTTAELADIVNRRGKYRKRDGSPVDAFQIHGRTRKYAKLFEREGSQVRLR